MPPMITRATPTRKARGALIRNFRLARGLSTMDLARAVGCSYVQMTRIQAGTRGPSLGMLERLAAVLGVKIDDLCPEREAGEDGA